MIFIKISLQRFYCRTVQRTRLVRGAIVIMRNNREWHFAFYCTLGTCDACDERERLFGCCHWMSPLAKGLNHRSSSRAILLLFQQLLLFCCWPLFKYILSNEYFQSTFFFHCRLQQVIDRLCSFPNKNISRCPFSSTYYGRRVAIELSYTQKGERNKEINKQSVIVR